MSISTATIPGISRDLITRAYSGTSFSPDKRAEGVIAEYHGELESFKNKCAKLAPHPEQMAVVAELAASYGAGLAAKYRDWLQARTRLMSPMITGPANFPTRRNQKAGDVERKRLDELCAWSERAENQAFKTLLNARTPAQKLADEWRALEGKLTGDMGVVLGVEKGELHYDKALFKTSMFGRLKRIAKNGQIELLTMALDFIKEHQKSFKHPVFTARHSIWKLPDVANQAIAKRQSNAIRDDQDLGSFASVTGVEPLECKLVAAHSAERLRLYFDRKPSAAIRSILKRSGWRWSPQAECWQRKLTQNALYNVRFITRDSGLEKIV